MAKPQSYIAMMIARQGDEWLILSTPENIQNSFRRIIKDMVKGIVDYEAHGKYFLDPKFMENLIIAITNELEINTLNLTSCKFYYANYPQAFNNMGTHIAHLESLDYIYRTILDRLYYTKNTGNVGYLTDIPGVLFNYRNHLN